MREIILDLNNKYNNLVFNDREIREGENLGAELVYKLDEEFTGYHYLIVMQNNANTPVTTPELTATNGIVRYPLPSVATADKGTLKVEFQAYEDITSTNKRVIKSAITTLRIAKSLDGSTTIVPSDYAPWYVLAAEKATEASNSATSASNSATAAATSATQAETYKNQAATIAEETAEETIETTMSAHIENTMPHQAKDITNNKVYKFGLQVVNGTTQFIYEEVTE